MKTEIYIIIVGICLVLGLFFFIFNIQKNTMTGFAIYNDSSESSAGSNESLNEGTIVTKEDVLLAINESEKIIKEMQENNFSVNYMNDGLIEAKRVFEQARYAEILRGEVNASDKEKQEARQALRLVKWQDITYSDVLLYTEDIKKRKDTAFLLLDKIAVKENNLKQDEAELKSVGLFSSPPLELSNETRDILIQAKTAFLEERYNDSEKLLEDFEKAVEQEKAQASTLSGIRKGARNFFQKYWIYITIFLIIILIAGYFVYKKFEKKLLTNKIRKMKIEEQVLNDLMKKAQEERFKENKISGLVYNIRMKRYEEKLNEIKQMLPVLETRLKRK